MRIARVLIVIAALAVGWQRWGRSETVPQPAQSVSADRVRQQQQVQQQVRDMARQLASETLDLQLQQLRENNLTSHPWYGEIRSMRGHLDEMVNREMADVIKILEKSDLNDAAQRVKAFQAAREKSRQIVVRLLVEQQVLMRRLKIAELARMVQQLIEHQTKVMKSTQSLPEQTVEHRQELNLVTLEDQADVRVSFGQFKVSLGEASRLSGMVGRDSGEALRQVAKMGIDGLLASAEKNLRGGDFPAAVGNQNEVIQALESLLVKIRNLQKTYDASTLQDKIAELEKQQQEIREESEKKPLEPEVAEKLAAKESEMAKKIGELAAAAKSPEVQAALENAKKEAQEASANLFEQKQPEALAHEDKAAVDLKAAEQAAEHARNNANNSPTAEDAKRQELENKIDQLTAAAEKLEQAAKEEKEVAKDANEAAKEEMKPDQAKGLEQKNQDAADTAKSAEDSVKDAAPKAAEEAQKGIESSNEAGKDLKKAEQAQKTQPDKNGDKADSAKAAEKQAGEHAEQAGNEFSKAAEEARKEAQKAADELAKMNQDEGNKLADLQKKVDNELTKAMDPTTDRLASLAKAEKKIEEALKNQEQADATAQKAAAQEKKNGEKPANEKPNADKKPDANKPDADKPEGNKPDADKPDAGEKADPQQQVTDESKEAADLAQAAAPKAAETLEKAATASEEAHQETAKGESKPAADARKNTKGLLEQAKKEVKDAMDQLAAEAAKQLPAEAKESGELAQEAKPLDAKAAEALANAEKQAAEAAADVPKDPAQTQEAQNAARASLAEASAALAAHQQQLAEEAAQAEAKAQGNEQGSPHEQQANHGQQAQPHPGQEQGTNMANQPPQRSGQGAKKAGAEGADASDRPLAGANGLRDQPWFAKLPADVRDAIRSNSQRRPPPGYEQRVQEYFENADR